MIRVKAPLCCWAKESVSAPHSRGWIETLVWGCVAVPGGGERLARLWFMLKAIAPESAGEEGWSVATTVDALARAQMREGRAAPTLTV